jgi:hypothetical protein
MAHEPSHCKFQQAGAEWDMLKAILPCWGLMIYLGTDALVEAGIARGKYFQRPEISRAGVHKQNVMLLIVAALSPSKRNLDTLSNIYLANVYAISCQIRIVLNASSIIMVPSPFPAISGSWNRP